VFGISRAALAESGCLLYYPGNRSKGRLVFSCGHLDVGSRMFTHPEAAGVSVERCSASFAEINGFRAPIAIAGVPNPYSDSPPGPALATLPSGRPQPPVHPLAAAVRAASPLADEEPLLVDQAVIDNATSISRALKAEEALRAAYVRRMQTLPVPDPPSPHLPTPIPRHLPTPIPPPTPGPAAPTPGPAAPTPGPSLATIMIPASASLFSPRTPHCCPTTPVSRLGRPRVPSLTLPVAEPTPPPRPTASPAAVRTPSRPRGRSGSSPRTVALLTRHSPAGVPPPDSVQRQELRDRIVRVEVSQAVKRAEALAAALAATERPERST
jgi:hypothetical protein